MARRGRGQFQFTVVELSVIAVSFAATSALVFLLGFYVGRENAAQHAPLDEKVARIPVGPAPPKSDTRTDDEEGMRAAEPPTSTGQEPEASASGADRAALSAAIDGELDEPVLPLVPGHQIVGRVEEIGDAARSGGLAVGQAVGVPWLGGTCGVCDYCRSSRENLCDEARFTGYHRNGGYAEFAVADARYCVREEAR